MRLLITGGFGYLGGRLAQHLAQTGHDVVLGSRQIQEAPSWLPTAEVVQTPWDNLAALQLACKGIDVVIHTAGMNARDCLENPVEALRINGVGTAALVQAAIRQQVAKLIYFSTAHIYGSPPVGEISEASCSSNLHPYATSHRAGEDAVLFAHKQGNLHGIVLRLANGFGVPADINANCWMLLIQDLCRQAIERRILQLHSDGSDYRNFISITHIIRAVEHFMTDISVMHPPVFNLGSPTVHSVFQMAEMIQQRCLKILGFKPEIERPYSNERRMEPLPLNYKIDRLLLSGFIPTDDVAEELDQLLLFCKQNFNEMI